MSAGDARPALLCGGLLAALDASEGRRRRRKRDTTPDAIGLGIKRDLLERAVREDPAPEDFEGWLLAQCLAADGAASVGATRMMALEVLAEWRLAQAAPDFLEWLARGAPSADAGDEGRAATDVAALLDHVGKLRGQDEDPPDRRDDTHDEERLRHERVLAPHD